MTGWHKWVHFHKLRHRAQQDSVSVRAFWSGSPINVGLLLLETSSPEVAICMISSPICYTQSVCLSVYPHASFWPSRRQPAAAMLLHWHFDWTIKSYSNTFHSVLKNVGDNVTPLAAFSPPLFFPPNFGTSNYPAHVAPTPRPARGWSQPRASSRYTGSRRTVDSFAG